MWSREAIYEVPRWVIWLGFVVLCNGVGFASSLFGTEQALYAALAKPTWAPPSWVFGPVWTALYTLMGTATYLVWSRCDAHARRPAMRAFVLQLVLNFAWTPVFFGLENFGLALVVIVLVLGVVLAMLVLYARRVRLAGWLVAPLAAWVAFATALNASIWWLNR
ncbi:MAG: TspO/MBR family protein [Kofleriaceae bacterium]|nr:TspO/MBR family protein [Kofleriaceae bacterium]